MGNLSQLLKWSIEQGSSGEVGQGVSQLTEERRKFFMEAYNEYVQSHVDVLAEVTKRMQGVDSDGNPIAEDELVEIQEEALEAMLTIVDNIDFARDFTVIGGLEPLLGLLASPHASLRRKSAEVVATVVHNNPPSQQLLLDNDIIPRLLSILRQDGDASVRSKVLLAISSQIRNHDASMDAFLSSNGFEALCAVLGRHGYDSEIKEVRRVLFLIPAIIAERPEIMNDEQSRNIIGLVAPRCVSAGLSDEFIAQGGDSKNSNGDGQVEYNFSQVREFAQMALVSLLRASTENNLAGGVLAQFPQLPRQVVQLLVSLGRVTGDDAETAAEESGRLRELLSLFKAVAAPEKR